MFLGFDYGPGKIGAAVGQSLTRTATPLTVLVGRDRRPDWDGIAELVRTWNPDAFVVGLPLAAEGGWQPIVGKARRFMRDLQARFGLPVYAVDERYSSWAARTVAGGRAEDPEAARIILESWLRNHA